MNGTIALAVILSALPLNFRQAQRNDAPSWTKQSSGSSTRFRGVSAVSQSVAWVSGNGGAYARTNDGGITWQSSTVPGAASLDFRDVHAVDAQTAYLLSIGEGELSRIYKTVDGGQNWKLQFTNSNPKAFFDAMAFWDRDNGIAISDPVDGRFLIITTTDGGATWKQIAPRNIPPALRGEAAFAASGTCITVQGENDVWFATGGGAVARVFTSRDKGRMWAVNTTPILSGSPSSGIFSVAFKDARNGVVVGGDYKREREAARNVARTSDGGRTWTLIEGSVPTGFRSGVAYVPGTSVSTLVAVGPSGSDYSVDGGLTWSTIGKDGYHAISFAGSRDAGWAVGEEGLIAKFAGTSSRRRGCAGGPALRRSGSSVEALPTIHLFDRRVCSWRRSSACTRREVEVGRGRALPGANAGRVSRALGNQRRRGQVLIFAPESLKGGPHGCRRFSLSAQARYRKGD